MAQTSTYERQIYNHTQQQQQVLQMPEPVKSLSSIPNMSDQQPKISRLELMKQNYERKRQKDFDEKLKELRARQPRIGSNKAHSGGTVRAFFAERRALEVSRRGQEYPSNLPPIEAHFKKMMNDHQGLPQRRTTQKQVTTPPTQNFQVSRLINSGKNGARSYHRKKSRGIDRQNPLPPLQRGLSSSNIHKPPTPNRRYETHHTLTSDEKDDLEDNSQSDYSGLQSHQKETKYLPQPPTKPKPPRTRAKPAQVERFDSQSEDDHDSLSMCSDEPPPNLAKLKALRIKRLSQKQLNVTNTNTEKPTDFQKWQMQQDQERHERLEKHKTNNNKDDSGPVEKEVKTLSMIERELEERIRAGREELSQIKKLQQESEQQEQFEREESNVTIKSRSSKENDFHKENSYETENYEEEPSTPVQEEPKPVHMEPTINMKPKTKPPTPVKEKPVHMEPTIDMKPKTKPQTKTNIIKQETLEVDEDKQKDDYIDFYEQAAKQANGKNLDLSPCSICGRNFATDRLSKHQKVCLKITSSKRKVFDGQKQRISGMEHEKYVLSGTYKKEPPKARKPHWRTQHDNFIKNIRYAKGADNEPPPVTENPHYVACPYCNRKFNPETADRHIPRCKDIKARPAPPKSKRR